jgi:hypothetical protein
VQGVLKYGTHTFRVRLWVEEREIAGQPVRVPGEVEYLRTGRTKAVKDGRELLSFIEECLDDAGVPAREGWRP